MDGLNDEEETAMMLSASAVFVFCVAGTGVEVDLSGAETYRNVSYRWTAREPVAVELELAPNVPHTLHILWGSKGENRTGRVTVNGHAVTVSRGGYDGFDWVLVDAPGAWIGPTPAYCQSSPTLPRKKAPVI